MLIRRSEDEPEYKAMSKIVTDFVNGRITHEEFLILCDLHGFDINKDAVVLD